MILEKLRSLIADQLGVDSSNITMDTNFEEDLGVDSLDIVELSMALEEEFDIGERRGPGDHQDRGRPGPLSPG